jgi:hypothetical protein
MSLGVAIQSLNIDPDTGVVYARCNVTANSFGEYLFAKKNCDLGGAVNSAALASIVAAEAVNFAAAVALLASQTITVLEFPDKPTVAFGSTPVSNSGYGQVTITATVYGTSTVLVMTTESFIDWSLVTNPNFAQRISAQMVMLAKLLAGNLSGAVGSY